MSVATLKSSGTTTQTVTIHTTVPSTIEPEKITLNIRKHKAVKWDEETVDNELMNKRNLKVSNQIPIFFCIHAIANMFD